MKIHICKASQTIYTEPVPSIEIRIGDGEFPEFKTLPGLHEFAGIEAGRLEAALYRSLPGATYDRLLGEMLKRKATHFRIAHEPQKLGEANRDLLVACKVAHQRLNSWIQQLVRGEGRERIGIQIADLEEYLREEIAKAEKAEGT